MNPENTVVVNIRGKNRSSSLKISLETLDIPSLLTAGYPKQISTDDKVAIYAYASLSKLSYEKVMENLEKSSIKSSKKKDKLKAQNAKDRT